MSAGASFELLSFVIQVLVSGKIAGLGSAWGSTVKRTGGAWLPWPPHAEFRLFVSEPRSRRTPRQLSSAQLSLDGTTWATISVMS